MAKVQILLGILVLALVLAMGCMAPTSIPVPQPTVTVVATPTTVTPTPTATATPQPTATATPQGKVSIELLGRSTAPVTVDVGTSGYLITVVRITEESGEKDFPLSGMRLLVNVPGGGEFRDENLRVGVMKRGDDTILASSVQPRNGVVTLLFKETILVPAGTWEDFLFYVDVMGGVGLTIQFLVEEDSLVIPAGSDSFVVRAKGMLDSQFPLGDVPPGYAGNNSIAISLGQGGLVVEVVSVETEKAWVPNGKDIELGRWRFSARGVPIVVLASDLAIFGSSVAADFSGDIRLVVVETGQVLYSVSASTAALFDDDGPGADQVFLDVPLVVFPKAEPLAVVLLGDASSTVSKGNTAWGAIGNVYHKRLVLNNYGTLLPGTFLEAKPRREAQVASLLVVHNDSVGSFTIVEGQRILLDSYLMQAGPAEGLNGFVFGVTILTEGDAILSALSDLELVRADTGKRLGSVIRDPVSSNMFRLAGTDMPATKLIQIDAYVSFSTEAARKGGFSAYTTVIRANEVEAVGKVSKMILLGPPASVVGRTVTVLEHGIVSVSVETKGAAASAHYASGQTGLEMLRVRACAYGEGARVRYAGLGSVNGASNIASAKLLGTGLDSDPSVPLTTETVNFFRPTGGEIAVPNYGCRILTSVVDITEVGTTIAGQYGTLGFLGLEAIGEVSGSLLQERVTGSVHVAGIDTYSGSVGDIIYVPRAASSQEAGYFMVTVVNDTNLTTAEALELNGGPGIGWARGDIITRLNARESISGNTVAGVGYNPGDVVYVYDSDDNEARFAIVTVGVKAGDPISNLGFSPAGSVTISSAGDRVVLFANPNALMGNTMRF